MIDARLIDQIGRWIDQRAEAMGQDSPPPILGIAGSQGSGKSTLAKAVAERFGGASLSLDDDEGGAGGDGGAGASVVRHARAAGDA